MPLAWWWWYSQGTTRLYHTPQKTNMVHLKIIQIEKENHLNHASIFLVQNVRFRCVHPWKLTYPRKINSWKMWFLFKNGPFFGFHVNFSGGVQYPFFVYLGFTRFGMSGQQSQSLHPPPLLLHDCKAMPRVRRKWWTTSSRASCKTMGNSHLGSYIVGLG